jgi:hypothetical protein
MRARRAGGLCAAVVAAAIVASAGPVLAQSRRVETDPRTGRVVPPTDQSAAPPSAAQSTSSEGLVERAGSSRAGGVGVRLEGRFRSNTWVTRGPDGQLVEDCVPGTKP